MNRPAKQFLFWTPRALSIVFAIFLSLFALDTFTGEYSFWEAVLAFILHLIPTGILVLVLIISWRRELIGAILFFALALFYPIWAWGQFPFVTYLVMSGPLFLVGIFFVINWKYKAELQNP